MNLNITYSQTIDFDENIITQLKELIDNGLDKLRSFVKSKKSSDLKFYNELDKKFNNIAKNLENYEFFNNEFNYFLSISDKILYIIKANYDNASFGYCDYALELFDFFMEIWDAKMSLINNFSNSEIEKYKKSQIEFKSRHWNFESEFYLDIHESNGDFTTDEIYEIHENLTHAYSQLKEV